MLVVFFIFNVKLDSMRWFSHRRRTGGRKASKDRARPRGPLPQAAVSAYCRHPVTLGCNAMVSSAAACGVRCTAHALLCIVNGDDDNSAVFRFFCTRWPWPLTLTFELDRDFCTMHLTAKFRYPTFNRLEVIVRTNKQTNWHTDKQTNRQTNRRHWKHPPRSVMLRRWINRCKRAISSCGLCDISIEI